MELVLDPVVVWSARLVLAAVFGAAAVTKLRALEEFTGVVHNYRLLPRPLERPVAYLLPPFELAIAVGLLVEATRPAAAAGAASLLLVFAFAMGVNLLRGRRNIDCGCFASVLRQRLSWSLVWRNLALLMLALAALPPQLPVRALSWLDLVTTVAAAATLALLYAAFSRLFGFAPIEHAVQGGTRADA